MLICSLQKRGSTLLALSLCLLEVVELQLWWWDIQREVCGRVKSIACTSLCVMYNHGMKVTKGGRESVLIINCTGSYCVLRDA